MYKNVSLRSRTENGRATWRLLGPDGQPIEAFTAFATGLRSSPRNTRNSYCRHLAEFIDYLIEATALIGQGRQLSKLELTEVIEAYGEYLRLGADAGNSIAREVAAHLPPGTNAANSITPKKAAVRRFLKLSEEIRKEMAELAMLSSHVTSQIASEPLLPELGQRRALKPAQVRAMQASSMLAGVIAGGPKLVEAVLLDEEADDAPYDERRAFPYDKAMELIDCMPTYRDKSYYSLLGASGGRAHEILQTLQQDIDVEERTVRLVAPASRRGHPSYRFLQPEQRDALAWKGRTTDLTLLIEPFATAFFESLQKYLEQEHIPHGKHDFLFQYLSGPERGMPYFLSAPGTRLEKFHQVRRRIGVELPRGTGSHSLRHMYGTYTLNFFPRANGDYGLPMPIVQQLMGHADIKTTAKYARYDQDLRKLEVQNANRVLFRNGTPKRLLELKLDALEAQIAKVRAELAQEALSRG
ncbi:MAG: site-specific integrase [Proteobacteria bacterium]|nr:site-specific integrase [Pseudomonadota bacterium]